MHVDAHFSIIGIIILVSILLSVVLLIVGIIVAITCTRREKKEQIRVTAEAQKIDAMVVDGKITADEAQEIKQALGPIAFTETSLEPDTHIKVIGIVNIVLPAIQGLLLFVVFLGLLVFMGIAPVSSSGGAHGIPILLIGIILIVGLVFLAITIFHIIAAVALMKGRSWGRIVIIVFAILGITGFPIGTALGIYTLWALIFRENAGIYFLSDNNK